MVALLVVLLVAVPLAEMWVILEIADRMGLLNTLVLLLLVSMAGAWLLRQQGLATWARLQSTLARGEIPTREVTDGALILLGGALLLTPGFLTDIVGLVLLLPPTRAALKGVARRILGRWAGARLGRRTRRVHVARVQPGGRRPTSPPPDSPPAPERRDGGGGSLGTG